MGEPRWWECPPCDVRWKAPAAEPCWSCGGRAIDASLPPTFPGYHGMSLSFG